MSSREDDRVALGSGQGDGWVCTDCGDSYRCSSCTARRPVRSDEDRARVGSALQRQTAQRLAEKWVTPKRPSITSDIIHIAVTGALLLAHVALAVLSAYGIWHELTNWDGGVAFVYALAGLVGGYGAWRSAEGLINRTWQAVRVLPISVTAVLLLIVVLPFLTWSRSGP